MESTQKKTIRVLLTGSVPYWNTVAGDLLSRTRYSYEILQPNEWFKFLWWFLTGKFRRFNLFYQVCAVNNWPFAFFMSLMNKPYMIHWIGTDVLSFKEQKSSRGWRKSIVSRLAYRLAKQHFSDSPYLLDELKGLHIDASVIKLLPNKIDADLQPLPEKFSALAYWPNHRETFFRGEWIYSLAEMFPNIEFKVAKATRSEKSVPPNVTFLGKHEDMEAVYRGVSVFIRTPEHDSLSAMVLEALVRGRYVIYNKPSIPGCHYANSVQECVEALKEIIKQQEPNHEGAQFVRENFSVAKEAQNLEAILDELFGK
jgi:glycosyltransferase involved in cell wall biosynthesis